MNRPRLLAPALLLVALAVGGCSSDSPVPPDSGADLVIRSGALDPVLVEGDPVGLEVPLSLERGDGSGAPVLLTLEGRSAADVVGVTHAFDDARLGGAERAARLTLRLDIADTSIRPHTRRFLVVASDENDATRTTRTPIDVTVEPVDAPDVYLLIGQSNMVGASGDGTRDAGPGGPDEPDPRVLQLNVAAGDGAGNFTTPAAFTSPEINVVEPAIVVAEDPLHLPRDPERDGKGFEYIGLGLSFGKRASADTVRDVVLVPAAWSGSGFCDNENDPLGQWNADPDVDPVLGNTLLFDRALLRANIALERTGGILRGILWHQGEADANMPCAELYASNLARLAAALRTRIIPDGRGAELRAPDAPIPFVVGTMSRGDDYADYASAKQLIDDVHRNVAELIPHSAVSVHDDLVPANGYPCGVGDCIHFGARSLREMGERYHEALGRALAAAPGAVPDVPPGD